MLKHLNMPGVLILQGDKFKSYEKTEEEISEFNIELICSRIDTHNYPMIVICDDSDFTSATLNNWLWVTFTRSNPSHDIHGVNPFTRFKHFGCDSVIIDARIKPHHAPALIKDPAIEKRVDKLFEKGGSLEGLK